MQKIKNVTQEYSFTNLEVFILCDTSFHTFCQRNVKINTSPWDGCKGYAPCMFQVAIFLLL